MLSFGADLESILAVLQAKPPTFSYGGSYYLWERNFSSTICGCCLGASLGAVEEVVVVRRNHLLQSKHATVSWVYAGVYNLKQLGK